MDSGPPWRANAGGGPWHKLPKELEPMQNRTTLNSEDKGAGHATK